ncbi:MAG: RIP metalloprotease RseP [Campylobacter sp.]|nr:RIP metalloprotease RseP [Campylobacter sp.]
MLNLILAIALLALAFWHWGVYFAITLLAISFLIFFHELGHFLAAKHVGVKVNAFSVGFGEVLASKIVNGTEYRLSSIPLGGYVSLKGQEDLNPKARSDDSDSYNSITPWQRIYILFAGPFFNIILAFFIYIALGYIGVEKLAPKVGAVLKNSAATSAGVMVGDEIKSINGTAIKEWNDISKVVGLETLDLSIERDGEILNLTLTPKVGEAKSIFGEDIKKPLIGISPSGDLITLYHRGFSSIPYALSETIYASKLILIGLEKLVTGIVPVSDMAGIVRMGDITTQAAKINLSVFLVLVALISVNLGILNLFPLPVLDGGHIAFNLYEIIFRRPIPPRVTYGLLYTGMVLLFGLMVFTVVNDIIQLSK